MRLGLYHSDLPSGTQHTSGAPSSFHAQQVPINLLLLIISYLDNVGDLARITRTSRLLYYLSLPRLYEKVTLRAYSSIRYVNDLPEGFGSGSPFAMGLDTLISSPNNVAQYMKSLKLCGAWKEMDTDDFGRGRVPDNTMVLNIALKAAIIKAANLKEFVWELNTKPMKTIYQGLSSRTLLQCLKVEFPIDRTPKPIALIPAIPSLKYLHLANLDPLCYNDDVSLLIAEAKELETLKLHWNPRMRKEREPSINLRSYFGRVMSSNRRLKLNHFAMANLFSRNESEFTQSISFANVVTLTTINCMNQDDPATIFTDRTWDVQGLPAEEIRGHLQHVKVIRSDRAGSRFSKMVGLMSDLEEIYLVTHHQCPAQLSGGNSPGVGQTPNGISKSNSTTSAPHTDGSNGVVNPQNTTPISPESSNSPPWQNPQHRTKLVVMASDYIAAIVSHHSSTLKKLLLPSLWSLGREVLLNLVSNCPNLVQLAVSLEDGSFEVIRACVRAGPKLEALRFLLPPGSRSLMAQQGEAGIKMHEEVLMIECRKEEYKTVRWLGLGDQTFEICGIKTMPDGPGYRRDIRYVRPDDPRLKQVEIFGLDSLEI